MEFLANVVPNGKYTCFMEAIPDPSLPTGTRMKHYWMGVHSEPADNFIKRYATGGRNLYFAMASFNDTYRRMECVESLKAIWLDIDAGAEKFKKHPKTTYPNFTEAKADLERWLVESRMYDPTYIVASGEGLHVYWVLDKPVDPQAWAKLQAGLKQLTRDFGLRLDSGPSSNMVGVLRVPTTIHTKSGRTVTIIEENQPLFTYKELRDFLPDVPVDSKVLPATQEFGAMPSFLQGAEENRSAWDSVIQKQDFYFARIMEKSLADEGCLQLKLCYTEQDMVPEPVWRAALSIARNCVDGDEWIHKISDQYPGYSKAETEKKARETIDKPYTCAKFDDLDPEYCEGCPFAGNITSPIVLGRIVEEASEKDLDRIADFVPEPKQNLIVPSNIDVGEILDVNLKEVTQRPLDLVGGYFYEALEKGGGIWKKRAKGKDDLPVYKYPILILNRVCSRENGDCLIAQVTLPHDGKRIIELPYTLLQSDDKLKALLSRSGVTVVTKAEWDIVMNFLRTQAAAAPDARSADRQHGHYGWAEDMSAFVIGNIEYTNNGEVRPTSIAGGGSFDKAFAITADATIAGYRQATDLFAVPGQEMPQFVMASALAAPLFRLLDLQGCLIHCYARRSGAGKTTSTRLANAIWGRPKVSGGGSGLEALPRDNPVALFLRFGELHSISTTVDEITLKTGKDLHDLVYSITQGRDKDRGRPDVNKLRENDGSWTMAITSTGNLSVTQQLVSSEELSEALNARVIELDFTDLQNLWGRHNERKDLVEHLIKAATTTHAGIVGRDFAHFLVNNQDEVKKAFVDFNHECEKYFSYAQKERYWSATVTLTLFALRLGNQRGYWNFQEAAVWEMIKGQMQNTREEVFDGSVTPAGLFQRFLSENLNHRMVITQASNTITSDVLPRESLTIRQHNYENKLYIDRGFVREWCAKNKVNHRSLANYMRETLGAKSTTFNMLMGVVGGAGLNTDKRANVWMIDYKSEANYDD